MNKLCNKIYKRDARINTLDYIYLIIACIIASCGFLIYSETIIIGSMLISPLLKPVFLMAHRGLSKEYSALVVPAMHFLIMLTMIVIIGYLMSTISLFIERENEEQINRSNTLFGRRFLNNKNVKSLYLWVILIAISCGIVLATASVYQPKVFTLLIAGAGISASILPPFVGSGIELSLNRTRNAFVMMILGIINIIAIFLSYMMTHMYICS